MAAVEHPQWCVPNMCTVAVRPYGTHRGERQEIREGLFVTLWQSTAGRRAVDVEQWDLAEPDAANPTDVVELDLADAAQLANVLTGLVEVGGGAR